MNAVLPVWGIVQVDYINDIIVWILTWHDCIFT